MLASGSVPLQLLLHVLPDGAEDPELLEMVQKLLNWLEQASPEELAPILNNPELAAWARQVEQQLSQGGNAQNAAQGQAAASMPAAAAEQGGNAAALLTASALKEALSALQSLLAQDPQDPAARQLGQQLQAIVRELPLSQQAPGSQAGSGERELPQQGARPAATAPVEGQRQADVRIFGYAGDGAKTTENPVHDRGESPLQHLQRLAYLKPGAPLFHHSGLAEASAAAPLSETAAVTADTQSAPIPAERTELIASETLRSGTIPAAESRSAQPQLHAHHFATEMSRFLVKNMTIVQSPGMAEAKIKLVPEHLGQLDVKIVLANGQMTAYFAVESMQARELLESQLPQLRAALQQQGIQVDKLEVSQHQSAESQLFQEQRHRQPQQSEQKSTRSGRIYDDADLNFTLEMEQVELAGYWVSGSTFDASA